MDFQSQLKSHNLSITPVRLAVLETLAQKPHANASQILELVTHKITTTSIQAIYQNLNTLVKHGVLREIKPKGMPSLYETRVGDNHHHLICRNCNDVLDTNHTDTNYSDTIPCFSSSESQGFVVDEAEIFFWGICPKCQTNAGVIQ